MALVCFLEFIDSCCCLLRHFLSSNFFRNLFSRHTNYGFVDVFSFVSFLLYHCWFWFTCYQVYSIIMVYYDLKPSVVLFSVKLEQIIFYFHVLVFFVLFKQMIGCHVHAAWLNNN